MSEDVWERGAEEAQRRDWEREQYARAEIEDAPNRSTRND